jgi:hypothetical protein
VMSASQGRRERGKACMKHVASNEALHNEQAMQSWMMSDKINFFPSVAPGVGYGDMRCSSGTERLLLLLTY